MGTKELLQQYVSTGAKLPQYQMDKLPPGALKSYLRRRILQANTNFIYRLEEYEFLGLDEELKGEYIERHLFDNSKMNTVMLFPHVSAEQRIQVIGKSRPLPKGILEKMTQEELNYMADMRIKSGRYSFPGREEFKFFTHEQMERFITKNRSLKLFDMFYILPEDLRLQHCMNIMKDYGRVESRLTDTLGPDSLNILNNS